MEEINLTELILEVDDELIQEGVEPFQRPFHACRVIAERLSAILPHDDPLFEAVDQIYSELYRSTDLIMPPMHVGAFMFRDVFFPLRLPINLGSPYTNPVDFLTDVPEIQKRWLFSNKQTGLTFFDQAIDLMDFVYGLDDLEKMETLPKKTIEWWYLAKQQLEAAAATVLGSFNKYAAIQNCCISAELLLKGALFAKGIDKDTLSDKRKGYGHKLENLVNRTGELLPNTDTPTLVFAVQQLPDYVKSRYEAGQVSRLDLGRYLMNTQFISGEVLRQFSKRDFRLDLSPTIDADWNFTHRTFPKIIDSNT